MAEVLTVLSWILLLAGGVFALIGGVGLVRFPDFYTRLHAGGITDTLTALLIVGGLVLQSGFSLLTIKLLLILLFLLFTTPTATHALARAAIADGLQPDDDAGKRDGEEPSNT
jgi:multicomponent Na+:H+ antiporter subunit G